MAMNKEILNLVCSGNLFACKNMDLEADMISGLIIGLAFFLTLAFVFLSIRGKRKFLMPTKFQPLTLVDKKMLSHNSFRFRFALPSEKMDLGLPIGQHITFMYENEDTGKEVMRSYTPVTDDRTKGYVDFVIKVYENGIMSQHLNKLKIGESLLMRGPKGRFLYRQNMKRHFGMLAGGTGITPMYQIAQAILTNPQDATKISLIFGNVSTDDILIRSELEQMAKEHPKQFNVYFVVDKLKEGEDWKGGVGYITGDVIKEHLPSPSEDVLVLRCGPPAMNKFLGEILTDLGYLKEMQFQF
eukprot:TRINITY_DN4969_c0_g1_i1.p2 TRINITY_DN4969_c0_g1~~TRINITY_DN4969_c0_g1_i1.p2  ORF type:complete len:299 (-),score=42.66 TRINITY_DN4969_c0_g1_i1:575-1471(-)